MRKKTSRFFAVIVAAVMCFAFFPQMAFAETQSDQKSDKNGLVVFGSSTASGYGLPDFVNKDRSFNVNNNDLEGAWTVDAAKAAGMGRISNSSYPWKLKKYLEEQEGTSYELSAFTLNGMRTDEFRAILDEDFYMRAFNREKEKTWYYETDEEGNKVLSKLGFLSDRVNYFVQALGHGGATVDVNGTQVPVWTEDDNINIDGKEGIFGLEGTSGEAYFRAQKYVKEKVQNAKVIVIDNCVNNFGTYLAHRVGAAAGVPGFEADKLYSKQNLDDVDGADSYVWKVVKKLQDKLLADNSLIKNAIAKELLNAFIFCYADCVTNFSAQMEIIRELNPDAKIIVVGLYNPLDGLKVKFNGKVFDIGKYAGYVYEAVNTYLKAVDKNSSNYKYAENFGNVETFIAKMASFDDFKTFMKDKEGKNLLDNMYSGDPTSLVESFIGEDNMPGIIEMAAQAAFDSIDESSDYYPLKEFLRPWTLLLTDSEKDPSSIDLTWKDLETLLTIDDVELDARIEAAREEEPEAEAFAGLDAESLKGAVNTFMNVLKAIVPDEIKSRVQKLLFEGAKYDTLDLGAIAAAMNDMDAVKDELMNSLSTGELPSDTVMGLIHILDSFMLYMSVGLHPDANGCEQIFQNVKSAYEKDYPASGEIAKELEGLLQSLSEKIEQAASETDIALLQKELAAIAALINKISAMIDEYDASIPGIGAIKEKLENCIRKTIDIAKGCADKIAETVDKIKNSEAIQRVAEQIAALKDILENLSPTGPEVQALKEKVLEILENAKSALSDKIADISADLAKKIERIKALLEKVKDPAEYKAIIEKLLPVGEDLIAIGKTLIDLPEKFIETAKQYIELFEMFIPDRQSEEMTEFQNQVGEMTAGWLEVAPKTSLAFQSGKAVLTLSWNKDPLADGYIVKVNGKTVKATSTSSGMVYKLKGAVIGKTYTFAVTPYVIRDVAGEPTQFNGKTFKTSRAPKVSLNKVTLKKVTAGKKSFKASWKKVSKANGYQVFYKTGKKAKYKTVAGVNKLSVKIKKLKKGKKYTVKVRAYKKVNGKKYFGNWSKTKKVTVK